MAFELDQVFIIDEEADVAMGVAMQKQQAAQGAGDERGRALGLIKAADAYVLMDMVDQAWGQVSEALAICNEMKYEEGRAAAMNVMTKIHVKKGKDEEELEEALDSAMDTLKLFRKLGHRKGEAVALNTLSSVHHASKKAALSIQAAKESLAIFAELGEKRAMAEIYHSVMAGYMATTPPQYFLAAKQLSKAAALYEELGDKSKQAKCMNLVAGVESKAGDTKKAAEAVQKSQALYAEAGDTKGQAAALKTAMTMLIDGGMYLEALKVGRQRVTLFVNSGESWEQANALMELADVMMKNDDWDKAAKCAEVAMGLYATQNYMEGMTNARAVMDGAKHAKAADEIEVSIAKAASGMHVPSTIIVDPGLNKRITGDFAKAITG